MVVEAKYAEDIILQLGSQITQANDSNWEKYRLMIEKNPQTHHPLTKNKKVSLQRPIICSFWLEQEKHPH